MNIKKILKYDSWKFECCGCSKEFVVQNYDAKRGSGLKDIRDVKEGIIFLYPEDQGYSYYCKDCEQNINYN